MGNDCYGGYYYYSNCPPTYYQPSVSNCAPCSQPAACTKISNIQISKPSDVDQANFDRVITFDLPSGQAFNMTRSGVDGNGQEFLNRTSYMASNDTSSRDFAHYVKRISVVDPSTGQKVDRITIHVRKNCKLDYEICGQHIRHDAPLIGQPADLKPVPQKAEELPSTTTESTDESKSLRKAKRRERRKARRERLEKNTTKISNSNTGKQINRIRINVQPGAVSSFSVNGNSTVSDVTTNVDNSVINDNSRTSTRLAPPEPKLSEANPQIVEGEVKPNLYTAANKIFDGLTDMFGI